MVMALSPGPTPLLCLLLSFGLLNSSKLHSCPEFCTCEHILRVNCSSAGLSLAPQNIRSTVSELDLSHNQLGALTFKSKYYHLLKVWLGNNSITHFSLCVDLDLTNQGRSRQRRGLGPKRRCLLWAPTLQLLSVERNQLQTLPQGLRQQKALRILNLSFNNISKLDPGDFSHLRQLEELHLQHNQLAFLHPLLFEKLDRLKVLDLSFNLLTTLHPSTYVSLRDFGADVVLRGNSWICDCGMRFVQKEMTVDSIRGLKPWSIECTSPLAHSGMELVELDEDDLKCPDSENSRQLRTDITVHRGSRILLTCSEPDAVWWTPNGKTTRSQNVDGLLIVDITEQDEGLYLCMSQSHQTLSIFNVIIRENIRKIRSVSQETLYRLEKMAQTRNGTTGGTTGITQSHFALAVSFSVIITFIVAFILGVLLQPYICACWQKTKARKQERRATTVPNAQQEQHVNEAYLHCEDVDDFEPHRERRVTFTEYTEEGNMQYYDTVAGDEQGNAAVIGPGDPSSDSSDESGSEDVKSKRKNVNNLSKKVEFELIPDSAERNSLSSRSSISSSEGKILKKGSSTPKTSQTIEEQVQKTEVATIEVTEIQIKSSNDVPGFSSEPFADWSPHQHGSSIMNPDLGDQFEFSDSVRSGSPISPTSLNESFKGQNLLVPSVNRKIRFESSSSSSVVSDGEPTHYTVNVDSEDEAEVFEKNEANSKTSQIVKFSSSSSDSETESHHVVETRPVVDREQIFNKETAVINDLQKEKQTLPNIKQEPPTVMKRRAPLPPPRKLSSSSSDSEDEIHKLNQDLPSRTKPEHSDQLSSWPVINLERVAKVKRRLDFKVRYAAYKSFSSSDSEDERIYEEIKDRDHPKLPIYAKQESSMTSTGIKTQSDTSSSSDSEEEQEHYYENIQEVRSPNRRPVVMLEQEPQWPAIDLVKVPKVKRSLDFKTAAPTFDTSSSSDSEYEQISMNMTSVHGKVPLGASNLSKPSFGTSSSSESEDEQEHYYENLQEVRSPNRRPVVMLEQEPQWPAIDLVKVPKVKRSLDFKRVAPAADTSSSDSEDEQLSVNMTYVQGKVPLGVANLSKPSSGTSSSSDSEDEQEHYYENIQEVTSPNRRPVVMLEQQPQWPVIDLVKVPKVKRSLDFKIVASAVDTSSSSDSEDDERLSVKITSVQGKVPLGVSQPSSGTSSSSESEDEQEIDRVIKENLQQVAPPIKQLTAESPWPVIDLGRIPKVKRRLDVKERVNLKATQIPERVPSTKSDSGTSSSSESEDEMKVGVNQMNSQQTSAVKPPTAPIENQWPVIDLVKVPEVKRRLDIKTIVPASESSSSNSEDERVQVNVAQVQGKLPLTQVSVQKPDLGTSSSSESEDEHETERQQQVVLLTKPTAESLWPVIDLDRIPKVKRRMDVKERIHLKVTQRPERVPSTSIEVPKSDSETSSSSDSEEEQATKTIIKENLQQISPIAKQPTVESQWPVIDLIRIPKVKRHLDIKEKVNEKVILEPQRLSSTMIKIPKPEFETSSSSESEDEREIKEQKHEKQQIATTLNRQPTEAHWPMIDLVNVPKVKRRLDIKKRINVKVMPERVPSPSIKVHNQDSGTSSSSESEDEQEHIIRENLHQATSAIKPTASLQPNQWPVIDLGKIPNVKRRLDVKTTRAASESSSSDTDDEKVYVTQVKGKLPLTPTSMQKQDSETSSSSESEDEQKSINKQPSDESQWPVIDLNRVPKVKRHLDIKEKANVKVALERVPSSGIQVPNPYSGTSSSSESDDEHEIKVKVNELQQTISPIKPPTTMKPHQESQWPVINLVKIPKAKRRLDIKTTVQVSESSSSDSEDESVHVNVTQLQGKLPPTPVSVQKPDSGTSSSSDSEEETSRHTEKPDQWPIIDLKNTGKLKRRLDFKVKSASLTLPSGSNSESEEWKIKQTLTKSPKPESGTSSSSESEDERGTREVEKDDVLLVISPTKQPTGVSQRPEIDPVRIPKLKQRLDIKEKVLIKQTQGPEIGFSTNIQVTTSDSSSSESEDEQQIKIVHKEYLQQREPAIKQPESPWPMVNLVRIPKLKQRLDFKERAKVPERVPSTNIKVPKPESGTSSSSESEDEERVPSKNIKSDLGRERDPVEPQSQWPVVDIEGVTRIKRRLDFKVPLKSPLPIPSSGGSQQTLPKMHSSSSSSSDEEEHIKSSQISMGKPIRLPSQTSIGLDVKGPSMRPSLHKSSSSSDDENDKPKFSSGSVSSQDKRFIKVSPILSPTLSPTKTIHNIKLEKYEVVTDDFGGKSSNDRPSPVVTPELQSKWAAMNLGLSRFRKRLDITRTSSPSSPPPTSPKQEMLIPGLEMPKSVIVTEQVAPAPRREQTVDSSSSSSESEEDLKLDVKSSRVETDFVSPQVNLSSIPKVKRSLNLSTVQRKSSRSSSDEETVNMRVPDLNAGIPRIKRYLNIKAPTPPSSSSSDDEKVYAHKFSDVTDQRSIEYKRTIMKSPSYDSYGSNTQSHRDPPYVESSAPIPKKLSLDNIKRKLLPSKQNELPPNLRWTSVGSHLSEHPLPISRRHQDGYMSPVTMSPTPKHDSSDSSSSDDEQRQTLTVTQTTYNPRSVSFNTSPTILNAANFEERTELRGLSALKAKSYDRKIWESENETFTESTPVSVDNPPDVQTVSQRTMRTKTKISYAQSYSVSTSSPATEERRLADMMYGIPSYKRHIIRSAELPEDLPPPVPSTPLPEETADFTWRSPQSSLSRGNVGVYNVHQKRTVEESVDDPFYNNPNISAV